MGGEVVLVECWLTTSERIFSCNHQRTPGRVKKSIAVRRTSIDNQETPHNGSPSRCSLNTLGITRR
jgi:hypothetical protein